MCECDLDPPDVFVSKEVTARKQHKCTECRLAVFPGEKYERVWGVWDGKASSFKTCCRCLKLRQYVESKSDCFCPTFGNVISDGEEEIRNAWMPGDLFGFYRLLVDIRKQRRFT